MKIILEGCDGTGKTTLANILANKYGLDILHMTRWGPKNFHSYLCRYNQDEIISDRSFISEIVYSDALNRSSELSLDQFKYLLDYVKLIDYKIIILDCETSEIKKRLNIRNDESQDILERIEKINEKYKEICKQYDLNVIDTTNKSVDEIIKEIIERI